MKFMKSTSSEGSKCVNKLLINGGIKWVTDGPAVAKILAKANLV